MSSLSRFYGAPGCTKSFLALDIALSLATGHPWQIGVQHGDTPSSAEPLPVHYVMAEGRAVNAMRINAWLAHHGEHLAERARDKFMAVTQGVTLTPEGIAQYLPLVERDRPVLTVLDTKHRMLGGLDENSASDMGILVRALDTLRVTSGGCVLLIDHTGLGDPGRARGSSSIQAAMDTEVLVAYDGRVATATVTRDKATEPGKTWRYRLLTERVSTVQLSSGNTVVDHSAPVPVAITEGEGRGFLNDQDGDWWDRDTVSVPNEVTQLKGKGSAVARDLFRILWLTDDREGLTPAKLREAYNEGPERKKTAVSTFNAGWALLKNSPVAVVEQAAGSSSRWVLTDRFSRPF